MRKELQCIYKTCEPIEGRTNIVSCRYQRQQFALRLIDEMMAGKRIINIDEASLTRTDFLRKGWGINGKALRPIKHPLGHRLTLIAAVDNFGQSFFAVFQSTIDSHVLGAFLHRLVIDLDGENPDWRDDTIIVLDGAKIHRSGETRRAMAALRIPVMIAGPYGFDGSPAEKLFAILKNGELNKWGVKTGKT